MTILCINSDPLCCILSFGNLSSHSAYKYIGLNRFHGVLEGSFNLSLTIADYPSKVLIYLFVYLHLFWNKGHIKWFQRYTYGQSDLSRTCTLMGISDSKICNQSCSFHILFNNTPLITNIRNSYFNRISKQVIWIVQESNGAA